MSLAQKLSVQRFLLERASGVKGLWCKELLVSKFFGVKGFATVKTFQVRIFLVLCERLLLLVCVKAFLVRKNFAGKKHSGVKTCSAKGVWQKSCLV